MVPDGQHIKRNKLKPAYWGDRQRLTGAAYGEIPTFGIQRLKRIL